MLLCTPSKHVNDSDDYAAEERIRGQAAALRAAPPSLLTCQCGPSITKCAATSQAPRRSALPLTAPLLPRAPCQPLHSLPMLLLWKPSISTQDLLSRSLPLNMCSAHVYCMTLTSTQDLLSRSLPLNMCSAHVCCMNDVPATPNCSRPQIHSSHQLRHAMR